MVQTLKGPVALTCLVVFEKPLSSTPINIEVSCLFKLGCWKKISGLKCSGTSVRPLKSSSAFQKLQAKSIFKMLSCQKKVHGSPSSKTRSQREKHTQWQMVNHHSPQIGTNTKPSQMFSTTQVQVLQKLPCLCLKIPSPSQCKINQVILKD